jgi:Holliday junction resolvase RusA-like endonuclease
MPWSIDIEICGVPQGKGRPRFVRSSGIAFTPAHTRTYEANLKYAAQEAMAGQSPVEGPVRVKVEALFPIPASWSRRKQNEALAGALWPTKKPDADNILKMLDAFNEVVFRDDAQIVEATIRKVYSDRPALRVTVTSIAGGSA